MWMKNCLRASGLLLMLSLLSMGATCEKSPGLEGATGPSSGRSVTVTEVGVPGPNLIKVVGTGRLDAHPFTLTGPLRIGIEIRDAVLGPGGPLLD